MMKVYFLKEAQEDYDALDGSQKKWVEAAVERLKVRGGEI
jgi:mRNA-degrading endonuclease RelE of RelBE toxin-antitoxin system